MVIPKINSAHGSDTRNILNRVIDLINAQGKSIQDLVAEGQLTEEQYGNLLTTINGLLKSGEVGEYDLTPELRAEVNKVKDKIDAGDVTENDITGELKALIDTIPNKINHGNVSVEDIDKNKGKLDQTYLSSSLLEQITGNAPINAVPANNSLTTEKYVNESVTKAKRTIGGEFATVIFKGEIPNLNLKSGERGVELKSDFRVFDSKQNIDISGNKKVEFAGGANSLLLINVKTHEMRCLNGMYTHLIDDDEVVMMNIQFDSSSQFAIQQVRATFDYTINGEPSIKAGTIGNRELKKRAVSIGNTNFIEVPNYFNKDDVTFGKSLDRTTGEERDLANNSLSNKIQITGEVTLYLKNISIIVCYDKNDEYLTGWIPNSLSTTYTTHKDTEYIRVSARNDYLDIAMIYQGTEEKQYEPYGVKILGVDIAKDESGNENNTIKFPPEPIEAKFIAPEYEYQQMTLEEYYTAFDELVNMYPDNLKKKVFGKDMSGQYDVIQYHYIPATYEYENKKVDRPKPKITFISNVHGFEKPTALSTYYMIKAMLEDWRSNDVIEYLRSNVEMVFIPIANPYGYVNGTYKNGNPEEPVNIQVNFPAHWMEQDPSSHVYGGTEPMSEKETQYISEMIEEHSDALFFVDSHSSGSAATTTPENMVYFIAPSVGHYNETIEESLKYSVENISRQLSKNYMKDFEGVSGYYYLRPGNGAVDTYAASLGTPAYVSEIFYLLPGDESSYQPTAIKAMTETFANTLLTTLKTFKERM